MRWVMAACVMAGVVQAGEPTADRIAAVREETAAIRADTISGINASEQYLKRIKQSVLRPKGVSGEETSSGGSLPNGQLWFRTKEIRDARRVESEALLAERKLRLTLLDKGHVVFPHIRPGIKVGSYGRLPTGWVRVMKVESETQSVVRLEWKNHDWETVVLDGVSTKNWADDQVLDALPGAYECDSVRRDGGTSTLVLTPIDPAPYEAAIRRK